MNFLENHNPQRNENPDASLQGVEARLQRAQNIPIPDATFFQAKLKAQILEKKRAQEAGTNSMFAFFKQFKPSPRRTLAAVLTLLLIFAITATYFNQSGVFVSPVYAQDNFEVTPTVGDTLAVDSSTHFLVKSKTAIDTSDLKKSLRLTPDVAYKIEKKSDHEFEVIPEKSLKEREVYNLKIDYEYKNEQQVTVERNYSFAFQVKNQLKVVTTLPGKDTSRVPLDSGIEVTFSSDNVTNFDKAFKIEPAVNGKFEKHNRTWVFVPSKLAEKQLYTVTVSKDITVNGAKPMTEDYSFAFETSDASGSSEDYTFRMSWNIYDTNSFLEFGSKQTVVVPVWLRDGSSSDFAVRTFAFGSQKAFLDIVAKKDATPGWASYTREKDTINTAELHKVAEYQVAAQKYSYNNYVVLPDTVSPGYYVIEVEKDGLTKQVLMIVSDLTTFVEVTDTKTLVWVNNLLTQKPESGAVVQDMKTGTSAITNETGVAVFETNRLFPEGNNVSVSSPHYFEVKNSTQSIVMRVYNEDSMYNYYDNRGSVSDNYWKYISLDRGVYKTTDTVKFWGSLKLRTGVASNSDVTVALLAPTGWSWYAETDEDNYLLQNTYTVNEQGIFQGQLNLNNITPGYYTLVFKRGDQVLENRYIEVQAYVKPAYSLSTTVSKNAVYANEPVVFKTTASFFEGTPVSQLELSYSGTSGAGNVKTSASGEASVTVKKEYTACALGSDCYREPYLSLTTKPARAEDGEISQYQSAQVYYAHVSNVLEVEQLSDTRAQVSSTVYMRDLSYLNNDNFEDDGLSVAGVAANKKVQGLIKEISYNKQETGEYYDFINKRKVKTYTYNRVEKDFMRFDGMTDNTGHYSFDFSLDSEKSYNVSMLVDDGFGFQDYALAYYYTRKGYESGQSSNYTWYSLRLPENKFSFSVGEQVNLQSYQNENKLEQPTGPILYYTLQDGLQKYDVTNSGIYSFVFGEQHVPNVYVGAVYFDGKSYSKITQDGLLNVPFKAEDKALKVVVQTDKAEYKPGDQATLSITAKDAQGNVHPTTVNVSVIDEAYFAVGSSGAGDPLFGLYGNVASGEQYSYQTHNYSRLDRFGGAEKGCFLPGTKITMGNGTSKNIEDVKVGDEVLTFQDAASSEMVKGKVVKLQNHIVSEYLVINEHLRVTPEHRMLVNGLWRMAGSAKVGDMLRDENNQPVAITSIQKKYSLVKVYNFTVDVYHTYIADGIWVHNDKGDGAARMNFPDVALYQSVTTDANGKATLSFKLPDNITSWRITTEAVSTDLYGGFNSQNFNASLPLFATTNFAQQLLSGDAPLLTVRAFGKGVGVGEKVQGSIEAAFLPQAKAALNGNVFEPLQAGLTTVNTGDYVVTTTVRAKQMSDTLVQNISVVPTRLTRSVAVPVVGDSVPGGNMGLTKFVITDSGRGKYYSDIITMYCGCGDRVDQKVGLLAAGKILQDNFKQAPESYDMVLADYQHAKGGIKLLPYASPDLELSAKMASLIPDAFDQERLAQYFYDYLSDGKQNNREEVVLAVYGLASLHEPVLPTVRSLGELSDLTPHEKIYVGLSFAELGDLESARKIYREVLDQTGSTLNSESIKVKIGNTPDDVIQNTILLADLGAFVNEKGADMLYHYALTTRAKDILINVEKLLFLQQYIPTLPTSQGEVTVSIAGKTQTVKIENGSSEELWSAPASLPTVKFSNIKGPVQIMSVYEVPLTEVQTNVSKELSVEHKYFVEGKEVQLVHEGDMVEVRIYPKISQNALGGDYQITDVLPAGLRAVTNYYYGYNYNNCSTRYPSEVNGQIVKFLLWKGGNYSCSGGPYFSYYARVSSLGIFKTDNIILQSLKDPDYLNYSGAGKTLTIQD